MEKIKTRLSYKDKIIIKHFIKFLREKDALVPFCSNLALRHSNPVGIFPKHDGSLSGYLQFIMFREKYLDMAYNLFIAAFSWSHSKEEFDYWYDISFEYYQQSKGLFNQILMQETAKPTMVKIEVKWQNGTKQIYHITGRNVEQVRERLLAKIGGTKLPYGVRKQILERFYAVKK